MAKQDELELEQSTEGRNNPNDDRRKQLYAQSDEEHQDNEDFTDVNDEDFDKTTEIVEETVETKTKSESETVHEEESKKRTFKVNGKDLELTEEQIAEYVQKGASANERYEEAARLRREAEELRKLPVKTDAAIPQVTDDDLALARALQMGDEKEAAAVIARLRSPVGLKPDQVARLVDERVSFQSSVDAFKDDFPEIASDPYLWQIAMDKDEKLVAGGDTRSYFDRYKAIGEDLRNWLKTKAPESPTDKQARKASVAAPVKSGMRAQSQAEDDRDESPSEVIAGMAKKRGQGYFGGNV